MSASGPFNAAAETWTNITCEEDVAPFGDRLVVYQSDMFVFASGAKNFSAEMAGKKVYLAYVSPEINGGGYYCAPSLHRCIKSDAVHSSHEITFQWIQDQAHNPNNEGGRKPAGFLRVRLASTGECHLARQAILSGEAVAEYSNTDLLNALNITKKELEWAAIERRIMKGIPVAEARPPGRLVLKRNIKPAGNSETL